MLGGPTQITTPSLSKVWHGWWACWGWCLQLGGFVLAAWPMAGPLMPDWCTPGWGATPQWACGQVAIFSCWGLVPLPAVFASVLFPTLAFGSKARRCAPHPKMAARCAPHHFKFNPRGLASQGIPGAQAAYTALCQVYSRYASAAGIYCLL